MSLFSFFNTAPEVISQEAKNYMGKGYGYDIIKAIEHEKESKDSTKGIYKNKINGKTITARKIGASSL